MGFLDNLDDPKTQLLLQMGIGLLSPSAQKMNFGGQFAQAAGQGLQGYAQARTAQLTQQTAERANRASDLQQIVGLLGIAQKRDAMQRAQEQDAGIYQHTEDPMIAQLTQKASALAGFPLESGGVGRAGPPPPQQMPPQPGPQMSTPQNPQFRIPPPQGMPQQTMPPQGVPQPQGDPFAQSRRQGDYFAMAGFPEIAQNRYKMGSPLVNHGLVNDPRTGQIIGGVINGIPIRTNSQGDISAVPSDLTAQLAERASHEAAAREGEQYRTVPIGNGQTQLMRTKDYAAQQVAPSSPVVSADVQTQRNEQQIRMIKDELSSTTNPEGQAALRTELAALQGAQARGQPFTSQLPPSRSSAGLGVTPNPAIQASSIEEGKARGASLGEYGKLVQDQAEGSPEIKARIADIQQLAQTVNPGVLAPYKMAFGAYLRGFGVPEKTVAGMTGNVGDMQALIKQSMTMAFGQTRSLGSREAAQVIEMSLKANPGLSMTPEGLNRIAGFMNGVEDWKLARNDAKLQWQTRPDNPNKSLEGFQQYWDKTNPVTKYVPTLQQMSAPIHGAPQSFATEAVAAAANLPKGTRVIIGGRPGTWQ